MLIARCFIAASPLHCKRKQLATCIVAPENLLFFSFSIAIWAEEGAESSEATPRVAQSSGLQLENVRLACLAFFIILSSALLRCWLPCIVVAVHTSTSSSHMLQLTGV